MSSSTPTTPRTRSVLKSALCVALPATGAFVAAEADAQTVFQVDQTVTKTGATLYVDVDGKSFAFGDATGAELEFGFVSSITTKPYVMALPDSGGAVHASQLGTTATNVAAETLIDATFMSGYSSTTGQKIGIIWGDGVEGYVAFNFVSGETTYYGYIDAVRIDSDNFYVGAIGYQAGGIVAGAAAVPEPSTYAMIAGLVAGSGALLRRRQIRKATVVG